ncbi:MAG: tetratricopeptide repeat protein [Elusimicrobiota bacterium]
MRESRRTNYVILAALLMIAAAVAVYASLVMRWFSAPKAPRSAAPASAAPASSAAALEDARREFRERLLDPRAHLRLSEALWKAGRPVDAFYVMYAARQIFPDAAFRAAHAEVVLGVGGPAAAARARLKSLADPALAVPIHAAVARDYPDSPEGRDSLEQLSALAAAPDGGPEADAGRLARAALEELYRADPKNPDKLAALAGADFSRGDAGQARALAAEAWNKYPGHAGAARVMGMLALGSRDIDGALKWLAAAWDRDPDDLYSAAKLAQIYDKRRGDPEAALPFYLALYRQNPDYADDEPAETRIRETLDHRRESLLKDAPAEGLGGRFKLDDASLRAEAALRAASFKDPRWIDALGDLLDDDTELVRRSADYALFSIAAREGGAVRARKDSWLGGDKPLVRVRALNLFADLDGMSALPAVAAALRDPNPGVRVFAKLMVLDHYYKGRPEAAKLRARYLSEEKDPDALDFLKRFPPATR